AKAPHIPFATQSQRKNIAFPRSESGLSLCEQHSSLGTAYALISETAMKPEDVMRHPLNVLTHAQRLRYFRDGYLVLPDYVPAEWLNRLRAASADLLDRSRAVTQSDHIFTLEEG